MTWTHFIIEAFCTYTWSAKPTMTVFKPDTGENSVIDNPCYIPDVERPKWCQKKYKDRDMDDTPCPNFECLAGNEETGDKGQCPFFAFVNVDKEDYKLFFDAWTKKINKSEKDDDDDCIEDRHKDS